MKILTKINRGAILTTVVVISVICYLIANFVIQNGEKPEIKEICVSYIQKEIAYNMLPLAYRVDKPVMNEAALNGYLAEMKRDIIAYYPQNEQYYKFAIQMLTNELTSQSKGIGMVYSYEKSIIKYDEIIFDKDTVNVQFTTNSTIESKDPNNIGSTLKEKMTQVTNDNIILQKIEGKWKVVFASVNRPMTNNAPGKIDYANIATQKN